MWPIFEAGSVIVVAEHWREQLWSASPQWVVESTANMLCTYQPAGTVSVRASNKGLPYAEGLSCSERKLAALATGESRPARTSENPSKLYVYTPGSWARVNLGWNPSDGRFLGWYVNFERPAQATDDGISSKDLLLDLYINPDRSWEWKDREEFKAAVDRRIVEPELQDTFEGEAQRVIARAIAGVGAFDPRWQTFLPPASWGRPELPIRYLPEGAAWKRTVQSGARSPSPFGEDGTGSF